MREVGAEPLEQLAPQPPEEPGVGAADRRRDDEDVGEEELAPDAHGEFAAVAQRSSSEKR